MSTDIQFTLKYDFAFSFAGEDRILVEKIKNELVAKNYSVFYDNDFKHELIGKDLYSYLRNVYKKECKYVVCFISSYYIKKIWTNLEITAIKERLMSTFFASDFLLPIVIDSSATIEDIPAFIGFYSHKSVNETTNLLIDKYNSSLVEDNYLNNISNVIKYINENVCLHLCSNGYIAKIEENKITVIYSGKPFRFNIVNELEFGVPSLLVYQEDCKAPDIFISWKRAGCLKFEMVYFLQLKDNENNISLSELIEKLSVYIVERMECFNETI